ncbi:MAG: hypothetical protein JWO35_766 [Candidatus Saccharibacteria bacterium]|nr:hypothetical protein [Candidatus Saccharibacteria bacterium]
MKLAIKLNPPNIGSIVALSVFSVALVGGVGSRVATAAANTTPYTPTAECTTQLLQVNGFKDDLARFKSNHYVLPTNLSNYEQEAMTHSDGQARLTYTGTGVVPSYADGKPVQVARLNYALVLQRHEGAIGVLQTKKSLNTQDYAAAIARLKVSIVSAVAQIDALSQNWTTNNASCANPVAAKKTSELAQERARELNLATQTRSGVETNSTNASKAYSTTAKTFDQAK